MTLCITKFKKYYLYWALSLFTVAVLLWWHSEVEADLLEDMTNPAISTRQMIDVWDGTQVWWRTIKGKQSVVVKATRLLLVLTIALSVTMILYNGMQYIIETWQGKEWKSLAKNVVLIIVWILIALFSSIIITLIQSVPESTLGETVGSEDKSVL
jgi:hypothetical protein